jgi:hypothetical protein
LLLAAMPGRQSHTVPAASTRETGPPGCVDDVVVAGPEVVVVGLDVVVPTET